MKNLSLILAVLLLSAAPAVHAVGGSSVVVTYSETLEDVSLSAAEPRDRGADAASETTLVFNALGQRFEVALQPNDRLLAGAPGRARDLGIYRGRLVDKSGSWVRITIADGVPTGLIWDGTEMLAIDASMPGIKGQRSASIYRLKDTYVEAGTMSCGVGRGAPKETTLATAYAAVVGELETVISQAPGAVEELKIGLVGDYEFTNFVGINNADAEIYTRMNIVDGIFSSQLGVQIRVEVIDTFNTPDDPFTTAVPGELLLELADYRFATASQRSQGLTFMFTGRNLDGSTAGIAFLDELCNPSFGVGLSEAVRNPVTDSLIAAHEIGHNFGAEHDGEAGSVCASVAGDFLMAPSVNGSDQFSSCSIDTMRPNADAAFCINPLAQTDVAIAVTNTPPDLLLGASTDLIFNVSNAGSGNATNVEATFALPTNLSLNSAASTVGSCISGGGQVDCTIGTLPGSGSASVALAVTASSVGSDTLDASVVADGDANLNDNSQSVPIVVNPATDLRIVNAASRSAVVDSAVAISPRIENVSTLTASNLSLSVSVPVGLRVDSASWPNGTCTVGSGSVTCQLSTLAAGSSASLDLRFTAIATGTQTYTASVSSSEADVNSSDNRVSGTVTVSSGTSTGGGSDSGGGAFGLLWAFLLTIVAVSARLRRP